MRRLLIVLAVLVACMAPNAAYAQEVDYFDSFTNGVGTWGSEQEEEIDSNSSVQEFENGGLLAAPAEDAAEVPSTVSQVNSTLDAFNSVAWINGNRDLLSSLRVFFGSNAGGPMREMLILVPIGICFMWWGVRKGLRVLMSAWRRGKASV